MTTALPRYKGEGLSSFTPIAGAVGLIRDERGCVREHVNIFHDVDEIPTVEGLQGVSLAQVGRLALEEAARLVLRRQAGLGEI